MADTTAPYAVSCSRERSGCQRCKVENSACTYSRSGIIRRNRKRKQDISDGTHPSPSAASSTSGTTNKADSSHLQSHLANDIEDTRERLSGLDTSQHTSLSALSSLTEACAAVWHDAADFDRADARYFLFEDHAVSWVYTFEATMNRGRPLLFPPPQDVLDLLRASRPHQVQDRAWLVMYYSVILSMISSTSPKDESTKAKLRCNLWLALNDVKILLEPSEANIQALGILASHVEEFTTPSLSWMLVTNACRMLQALGINHRRFDPQTRERRHMMFWYLNLLDSGLALIFGRSPTFHRAMVKEMALPTINQLLPFQPHVNSASEPGGLFGPHSIHRNLMLSRIMADIWPCLYEGTTSDEQQIESALKDLERWYLETKKVLEAAALAERPLRDSGSVNSIDLGLRMVTFQYRYFCILLLRSCSRMKAQCMEISKRMLNLLPDMVSHSDEPYNGIVWHLVCCPFTPFLSLFGEILSNGQGGSAENMEALAAMEQFPAYLSRMSVRNSLAGKLERIAAVFVQHARSMIHRLEPHTHEVVSAPGIPSEALPAWPPTEDMLHWDTFINNAAVVPYPGLSQTAREDALPEDVATWTSDLFGDAIVDWIGWDNQVWDAPMEGS